MELDKVLTKIRVYQERVCNGWILEGLRSVDVVLVANQLYTKDILAVRHQ